MQFTQSKILTVAAVLMATFGAVTAASPAIDHQGVIVGFQMVAAALLYYWAGE